MPPVHDTPVTIGEILTEVQSNLYEAKLRWFSEDDIFAALQEAYNSVVALLSPIEQATFVPKIAGPYYNLGIQVPNYMYLAGIYNPTTNLWLEGVSYKLMKNGWQTYLVLGEPRYYSIVDLNRVLIWPFFAPPQGALFLVFKASAPIIYAKHGNGISYLNRAHVPILPYSVANQLLQYFATADLLEQGREFKKAQNWWAKLYLPQKPQTISLVDQARLEIKDLARSDRDAVIEPYRWMFHGGTLNNVTWVNNETPSGTIDGVNQVFGIAQVPNPSASLILTKNGQILYSGVGYNLSGQTITLSSGYEPNPPSGADPVGDLLRVWYQIN